jgi:large subunit ribosomal protein L22
MQSRLLRPTGLVSQRTAVAFRPAIPHAAPTVASRRVASIVSAAAVEETSTPVVEPGIVKGGIARQTFQRGSPHKVRRILDVIRGRSYEEALAMAEYMPYKACETILKVLMSAGANAKNNQGAQKSKLVVAECYADGGPQLKRARPRAQGRSGKILKPTFHLTIRVEERD